MAYTLREIAEHLQDEFRGKEDQEIQGVHSLEGAGEKDLTFLADEAGLPLLKDCRAGAIIVPAGLEVEGPNLILAKNPPLSFARAIELILKPYDRPVLGVSERASLGKDVQLGQEVSLYPNCTIGHGVKLGNRVRIYPGAYVGDHTIIGDDTVIYANVSIYEKIRIGSRVIIHSGAVIGADGFGYIQDQGVHHKFPQVGTVVIEDDVEIGANTTIDRATLGETRIGKGTKVDNLVQIGHNCQIGQGCLFAGQSGIAGSCKLGNYVVLGGQSAVADHLELADGIQAGGQSGISKNFPPGTVIFGTPAYPALEAKKIVALTRGLPKMRKRIVELEKKFKKISEEK